MLLRRSISYANRLRLGVAGFAACAMAGWMVGQAVAQERFAGNWIIAGAVAAPWASNARDPSDEADAKRLVGQRLAIGAGAFRAPAPLGCAKPTYAFHDRTVDMLFEGGLNADGANKPTDPVLVARSLGINNKTMRAMTASCSEVEFVLIDSDTVMFGLNDRVFTMKRVK